MKPFALPFLLAAALQAAGNPIVPGLNRFATASYQQLAHGDANLIFSPFSISTALSMALDGARGQTAAEIARVLDQLYPDPAYHAAVAALVEQLAKEANTGRNELLNATGLWVQSGFPIQSDFKQVIQTLYRAPLSLVDFSTDPERARGEINSWTERNTKGRIRELFGQGSLDPTTRLMLTSAIYFNGKWQCAFRPQNTQLGPFQRDEGGEAQASFMRQTASFGYAETPALQILEMKYAGTGLAFDVLLPKAAGGLGDLEKSLTPEELTAWLGSLKERSVEVAVPKFRAEAEFSLRGTLSRMGMASAFGGSADFSGIDDRRDLALSDVRHKAFVDVSEEGTVAAAATGAMVNLIAMKAPPPLVFRADHPFAFLIRDTHSGLILFAGRLMRP